MVDLSHPKLPGRIVSVVESVAQHLRRSGWTDHNDTAAAVSLVKPDATDGDGAASDTAPPATKPKTARAATGVTPEDS